MDAIFPMTVTTIAKDQEEAAKMAVYFWSVLCEQELDLEDERKPTYQYMAKAMPHLMPTLLGALEKPNDDGEGDFEEFLLAVRESKVPTAPPTSYLELWALRMSTMAAKRRCKNRLVVRFAFCARRPAVDA